MGLTKRVKKHSPKCQARREQMKASGIKKPRIECGCPGVWFAQFPVWDDGEKLHLGVGVVGSRLKRWKVGCNLDLAKNLDSQYRHDLVQGLIKSDYVKVVAPMRFREWAKEYVEIEAVKAIDTYRERCQRIENVLMPFFGDKLLRDITVQDVEEWRRQRGANRAQATVNVDHTILRHMLKQAMKHKKVGENVAAQVAATEPDNARNRVLEPEEWKRLHAAAPEWYKPVLMMGYHTGMRLEEVLGLTWERVSLDRKRIFVPGALTKNGRDKEVPMTPTLHQLLSDLRVQGGVTRLKGLVFTKNGRRITHSYRVMQKVCLDAKVENFRFHDLRHGAVTNLADAGVDTETCMKIVGHASVEMFLRYRKIKDEVLDAAMLKLDTRLTPGGAATR